MGTDHYRKIHMARKKVDDITYKTSTSKTPCCHTEVDSISDIFQSTHAPENGDITVCITCGTVLQIANVDTGEYRIIDPTLLSTHLQKEIAEVQAGLRYIKKKHRC